MSGHAPSEVWNQMRSVYDLKPTFQRRLCPVVWCFAAQGVTPNQLTLAALSPFLTAADGTLARENHRKMRLKAFLNKLGNPFLDAVPDLPIVLVISSPSVAPIIMLAAISELAGVLRFTAGASRHHDSPLGESDQVVFLGIFAFVLMFWHPPQGVMVAFLVLLIVLLLWTIYSRVPGAWEEVL